MHKLVISDDEGKTIIVPLVRDLITVGRQEGNTIRLTERNVSRQHARLVRGQSGYRIEDLDSYNGITVNGARIEKAADLKDGDRVGIGDYLMALKVEAMAEAPKPPLPSRVSPGPGIPLGPPARLVMISAPAPGAEFSIAKPQVRIGRLEELDLCISHRSISREHARVLLRDGAFEIEDLQSANGIRVNGSAVKHAPLRSGDVVEFGQVRFRFVGPGENYTFDPSEEEPAGSLPMRGGPSRATMIAVVSGAAVLGGLLALLDRGESPRATFAAEEPTAAMAAAVRAVDTESLVRARAGCQSAAETGDFEAALRSAQDGLAAAPSDSILLQCKQKAESGARALHAFEEGKKAIAENKLEDAYFLFEGIPDDSVLRTRAEVTDTTARVAADRLSRAHVQEQSDPAEAKRLAASVVEMHGVARDVVEDAEKLLAGLAASAPVPATRRVTATATTAPAPRASAAAAEQPTDESPAKVARNCLARGDQRCAVRALEGHAESAQELALLIETYRALGETKKAARHMESFVSRYPTARQAPQYRQFIVKHEEP